MDNNNFVIFNKSLNQFSDPLSLVVLCAQRIVEYVELFTSKQACIRKILKKIAYSMRC